MPWHSCKMDPRTLLTELMRRHGENPNSLARKLGGKPSQPRIHKYLDGGTKEPRRSTMEPIAEHYGIPLDALYDPVVAEMTMRELQESGFKRPTKTKPASQDERQTSRSAARLGLLFDLLAEGHDEAAAFRAASQAIIDALRQLPEQPSAAQPAPVAEKTQGA